MHRWIWRVAVALLVVSAAVQESHARVKLGKSQDVDLSNITMEVHVTTGDVLQGVEYISKSRMGSSAAFVFRSNFDSVIEIKLPYLMFIDFGPGGVNLSNRQMAAKEDEIHLKNGNLITGTIEGFSGDEVRIETVYGDQKIEVAGVKHIIFRNRGETAPEAKPAGPEKQGRLFEKFRFRSRSQEAAEEKSKASSGEEKPESGADE